MPLVLGCSRWPVSRLGLSRRYHLRFATTSCAPSVRQRCRWQGCSAIAVVASPHALAELSILDISGNVTRADSLSTVRKVRIPKKCSTAVPDHSLPASPTSDSSRHHQSEAPASAVSTLATEGSSRQRTAPRKRQAASAPEAPDGASTDSKHNLPAVASAAGTASSSSSSSTQRKAKAASRADSKHAASQGAPQSSAAGEKPKSAPEKKSAQQQRRQSPPTRRSQGAPTPAAPASSTPPTSRSSSTTGSTGPEAPPAATSSTTSSTSAPANPKATMLDAIMKRKNLRKMRTLMSAPGVAKPKPLVPAVALQAAEPSQQQLSAIEAAKAKVARLLEQRAEASTAVPAQGQQQRVQRRKQPREAEDDDEVQERARAERLPRIHGSMTLEQREQAYQQLLHHVLSQSQLQAELRYNGVLPLVVQRTQEQDRARADAAGPATPARVHSGKQPSAADAARSLQQGQSESEDIDIERLQEMARLVNIAVGVKLPDRAFAGVRAVLLSQLEPRAVADRAERWAKVCGSTYTQQYLSKEPTLLGYEPAVLLDSLEVLNRGLGLAPGECVKLAVKHPVLIGISADYLDQRLKELQDVFHTGRSDTVNLVLGNPSVLVAPLALLRTKVRDLAMLLVESHQAVVELLLRSPLLSSRSSRWLAQSIQGLAQSLQRPAYLAARMVANKPSLLAVGDASLQWRWAELQRLAEDSEVQAATLARMTPGELARALCAPNTRFARFERMRELGLMGLRVSKPNFILAMGNPMFEHSLLKWQQRLAEGAAAGQDDGEEEEEEEEEEAEMEGEVEGQQEGGGGEEVGRMASSTARRVREGKARLVMA